MHHSTYNQSLTSNHISIQDLYAWRHRPLLYRSVCVETPPPLLYRKQSTLTFCCVYIITFHPKVFLCRDIPLLYTLWERFKRLWHIKTLPNRCLGFHTLPELCVNIRCSADMENKMYKMNFYIQFLLSFYNIKSKWKCWDPYWEGEKGRSSLWYRVWPQKVLTSTPQHFLIDFSTATSSWVTCIVMEERFCARICMNKTFVRFQW